LANKQYILEERRKENEKTGLVPVFGNVKRPLEFKMDLLVVVDESGSHRVAAAGEHAGGGFFFVD
jgi:hypothetical protein